MKELGEKIFANTQFKERLESYAGNDASGGWWIEEQLGALFFCCRCESAHLVSYLNENVVFGNL